MAINNREKQVKEFHKTFKQYIGAEPNIPPKEILILRLEILLEELKELAEGSGMAKEFNGMMVKKIKPIADIRDLQPSKIDSLDALADL